MQFLRTNNPIRYLIYTFGALCQNMEFYRPKICPKIYHCVGQE